MMCTMAMTFRIAIILSLLYGKVYSTTCKPFEISKENVNVALIGHSLLEINNTKHHECARTCMSFAICKSIDFDRRNNYCKLNNWSSVDPNDFETKLGSIFTDISEWPGKLVGSCSSRPCEDYQRCYQTGASHVCRDIICVINQEIDHGKLKINKPGENKFLDIALVKCDTGYGPSQREVKCQASGQWQPVTCNRLHDCKSIHDEFPEVQSGQFEIELWNSGNILTVNCDMETEGGGWTIFQRRVDGSVEFYRNFTEYDNGFGDADGELWLGLKYIQELAEQGPTEVRLDVTNENNDTGYETFQDFKLTDGIKYTLNIGSRNASAVSVAECLQYNNLSPFSTFDRDIDTGSSRNCAVDRHGGWWYNACSYVNLNGLYVTPGTTCNFSGAQSGYCGHTHTGFNGQKGLKRSSMMMRRT